MSGDFSGALSASKSAKTLAFIAIGLGVLGILLNIIAIVSLGGMEGYMELIEEYQNQYGY